MNENFEKDVFEIGDEPSIADIGEDEILDDNFSAEKINIPEIAPHAKPTNQGIKVFCVILAIVFGLTCCSVGGYFVGKNSSQIIFGENSSTSLDLQDRPTTNKTYSAEQVYGAICESVVGILVYNNKGDMGEASGIVYSSDGYIVTNDHIYASIPSAKFKIFTSDGKEYDAYYVAGDTRSDLAVLKISDKVSLKPVTLGNSDQIITGEEVCAVGCPNGYSRKSTITCGIVSVPKVRQSITSSYSSNFIQTDTAINPGNSGGALVNMHGQVIGVTSSKISGTAYEGVGYAIPSKTVKKVAESLIEHGNVKDRVRLGISYVFYNNAMAELYDLQSCGLVVEEVTEDSDLYGRIGKNDIITRVNDIEITDDAIILDILEELTPNDTIMLTVVRQSGAVENISAKLLADEGSTSYISSGSAQSENTNPSGDFNFPEGY